MSAAGTRAEAPLRRPEPGSAIMDSIFSRSDPMSGCDR
ncbi:unnamed protein product [[Actinomadura] parvosata subsp. kistnae]|nr:unnamed protein product [Actinomadura parvosata subsp. kistnae]